MNQIRVALNKLPPGPTVKVLRKIFALPTPAARLILKDLTKPRGCHKPWIHKSPKNSDWTGVWIGQNVKDLDYDGLLKRIQDCDILLFYVHGGGFRVGSSTMYMDTYIQWINILKEKYGMEAMIMSVEHRLAPECKYPGPVEDVVRAYEHLTKTLDVDPAKIIVAGDCSGATLALEMLFITHDPSMFEIVTDDADSNQGPALIELPRPAAAVFCSPIVTDETTSASWEENVKYDFVSQYTAKVIKREYFDSPVDGSQEATQILGIAKLETGFKQFLPPQVLMFLGSKEVLRDDSLELAFKAENDGVHWENIIEDCVHNWFVIREVVKDKKIVKRADDAFADFCFRSVRQIRRDSSHIYNRYSTLDPSKVLYENSTLSPNTSDYSSLVKSTDGLEIVLEEEEDDEGHASIGYYDSDNPKLPTAQNYRQSLTDDDDSSSDTDIDSSFNTPKRTSAVVVATRVTKEKPKTVFV